MANKKKQQDTLARIFTNANTSKYKLKSGESLTPGDGLAVVRYQSVQNNGGPNVGSYRSNVPIYGKVQAQATAPAAPAPVAPAPAPEPRVPQVDAAPTTAPGNPALSIPGIDVRLTGENIGIKAKRSKARSAGLTSSGTNRLTIPRSSGANSLNIG